MSNQQKILSGQINALVVELTETYGIEPEDIIFFGGDLKPFFSYEATCAIANQLVELSGVKIEPIDSPFQDSVSLRCTLEIGMDGYLRTRSAVGVANTSETDGDDKPLTDQQLYQLASARAIRNALKTAGIDLFKLHNQALSSPPVLGKVVNASADGVVAASKSNFVSLLAQAHVLGKETGLICGEDKEPWKRILDRRYVVNHSNELSESQLADFVAFLRTLVSPAKRAA